MQGSIMDPQVRKRLLNVWGYCERHAWIALIVESSFRHTFLMGPAIVYEDIMKVAVKMIDARGPMKDLQILAGFRQRGKCIVCENVSKNERPDLVRRDLIDRGQNSAEFRRFAEKTRGHWQKWVCGRCSGENTWLRCRKHLRDDAKKEGISEMTRHRSMLHDLKKHISAYSNGFRWEMRGSATTQDMAAMIGCVGWCSGWTPLLELMDMRSRE